MTRAWILSDLHIDHGTVPPPIPADADIAIVAGDVCSDDWLLDVSQYIPVLFVLGNHEFYGSSITDRLNNIFHLTEGNRNLVVLENATQYREDTTVSGATLWTDYNGGDAVAMSVARNGMNDHLHIDSFDPEDARDLHLESLDYLQRSKADVIVTHHAPHSGSIHSRYDGQLLNYAFFSHALEKFDNPPKLWVHGHTHDSFDYMVGDTRVICNPHGYPGENPAFDPALLVEI